MPAAFIYLLKLSVSLGVVFLFYQLVLRRLTFYNWNRWYLLGYSLLSFVIPFIDITPALQENELNNASMIQWVPVLYKQSTGSTALNFWSVVSMIVIAGMLVMLTRLLIQLLSFHRMMKKARLISGDEVSLYQVNESIIPFSFGNAVFINRNLHTAEELEEIIRHEFVHVKQRHSIDIILGEILCLLNWYNPFAWMIRAAIRQNLEFVADDKVLENGINKKQYQYLLLKVIGNNQFSIAQKFNFSSLKKRIAMMNKNKSAQLHLLRFLFLLPVLAVILVSFRKEIGDTLTGKNKQMEIIPFVITDTIPPPSQQSKGVFRQRNDENHMKDFLKRNTEVKYLDWIFAGGEKPDSVYIYKKNGKVETYSIATAAGQQQIEDKYGALPYEKVPLPPPAPTAAFEVPEPPGVFNYPAPPQPPAAPTPVELPANVQKMNISNNKATITLKNGQKENYDLNNAEQKAKFEIKYGEFVSPPPPPPAKANEAPSVNIQFKEKIENTDASLHEPGNPYGISGTIVKGVPDNILYILDGVEIKKSELDKLEPGKIESINVLKGNAAVAAYGEKGSNGVIIIKTKTSEKTKPITQTPFLFPAVKNDGC